MTLELDAGKFFCLFVLKLGILMICLFTEFFFPSASNVIVYLVNVYC